MYGTLACGCIFCVAGAQMGFCFLTSVRLKSQTAAAVVQFSHRGSGGTVFIVEVKKCVDVQITDKTSTDRLFSLLSCWNKCLFCGLWVVALSALRIRHFFFPSIQLSFWILNHLALYSALKVSWKPVVSSPMNFNDITVVPHWAKRIALTSVAKFNCPWSNLQFLFPHFFPFIVFFFSFAKGLICVSLLFAPNSDWVNPFVASHRFNSCVASLDHDKIILYSSWTCQDQCSCNIMV